MIAGRAGRAKGKGRVGRRLGEVREQWRGNRYCCYGNTGAPSWDPGPCFWPVFRMEPLGPQGVQYPRLAGC